MLGETLDVVLEVSQLVCHAAKLLSPLSSTSSYFSNSLSLYDLQSECVCKVSLPVAQHEE